ncbi:hypothetical protein AALP_AA5G077800 [Arabis alpina]|uniref:Uncharacterized protein n=1 Tax=Arabis alpina TaxID=50452 RepID=A0A087GVL8_ARAAL|nr:hypothetical protein AALP_AA5G077800 [Arabis alpina]
MDLDIPLFVSSYCVSEICDLERRRLPASLFLSYPLHLELVLISAKEESFESSCVSSLKYEICLTTSLRSNGSALSGIPVKISHRTPSTTLLCPIIVASQGIIADLLTESVMSWNSALLPVKIMSAKVDLKLVSLYGLCPQIRWQYKPTCVSTRPIYMVVGPPPLSSWPRFSSSNLYVRILVTLSSSFDVRYMLDFISKFIWTFLLWLCSQRILFLLKKSSRVIPEESIVLAISGFALGFPDRFVRCSSTCYYLHCLSSEAIQQRFHPTTTN